MVAGTAAGYFAITPDRRGYGSSPDRSPKEHPGLEMIIKGMPLHASLCKHKNHGLWLSLIESYELKHVMCEAVDYIGHHWFFDDKKAMDAVNKAKETGIHCDLELKGRYDGIMFKFTGISVNGDTFGPGYKL